MPLPKLPEIVKPCSCPGGLASHDFANTDCHFGEPGELLTDPVAYERATRLPAPLFARLVEQAQRILQALPGPTAGLPSDPVSMAITKPKFAWMDTPHIRYLGEEVAAAVERMGAIIVCMPPRHAKTTTCSMWTPFWYLVDHPENQVFYISYEANAARKWGARTRALVELYGAEYGLYLNPKKTAGDDWELTTGGGMNTTGVGGGISGKSAKLLIGDDLLKDKEAADSKVQREKVWDWWESTVLQRIEPDTTTIVIGTRYREDDVIGSLLKHSESGDGHHFDNITLRAKAEADDPIGREIGEGLWIDHPYRGGVWGQEYYDHREAAVSPYIWNSVYQQKPSPPGGNMVDPDWWRFYRPSELPGSFDQEIQSWDLALDSKKDSDSFQCGLIASRKNALVFIRDSFHEHCDINKVIACILGWNRIYPGAKQKLIERAISGPAVVTMLQQTVSGMLAWPPKGRQKESKESSLNACVPDIRSGNVLLPLRPDGTKPKWVEEFIEELRTFPQSPHNDYVDSFSQAVNFLLPSARQDLDRDHSRALAFKPPLSPADQHRQLLHQLAERLAARKVESQGERDIRRGSGSPLRLVPTTAAGLLAAAAGGSRPRRGRGMW